MMDIGTIARAGGYRLQAFDRLGSTNDAAMARGRDGDPGKLWIVAREQTAGRGRMARQWSSPWGNFYASLLLVDPAPQSLSPQLGFVAGVALADAVNELLPREARALLKWPNDLLIAGAKLSGILLEATIRTDGRFICAIGFGVNCATYPQDTPYPATHLAAYVDGIQADALAGPLTDAFAKWFDVWDHGKGFADIRMAWLERAMPQGSTLRVSMGDAVQSGTFSTIDESGRLVIDCDGGLKTFDAGDVFPMRDHTRKTSAATPGDMN